jgi:predicted secreted Zn-dependent protease
MIPAIVSRVQAPFFAVSIVVISGCASMPPGARKAGAPATPPPRAAKAVPPPSDIAPAPLRPTVTLSITKATTYYPVHGATTTAIFEQINAQRLLERNGEHASGLTSATSDMRLRMVSDESRAVCTPLEVALTLDLVVTLPRHESPDELPRDVRERWNHFVARVAAHEQRHVDISVDGVTAVKARIEADLNESASCVDLETTVRRLWTGQQAQTEKAQDEFDAEDRAKIDSDRKPLQSAIDKRNARLAALAAEVGQLDAALADLGRRAGAMRQSIDTFKTRIAKAGGTCSRPTTDRTVALCRQQNALVVSHNALVADQSSLLADRNRLAGEHDELARDINRLVETLNWVR